MKDNLTEIVFILDKSGSMASMGSEPIEGYNNVIKEQSNPSLGEAKVTLVLFNDSVEFVYENVDIKNVKPLTREDYYPNGCTSLLDAIGYTFNQVGKRLANTPENERPSKVVVFILTDGQENSSREFDKKKISEMIKEQTEKYSWVVDFMGTTQEAINDAQSYGIKLTSTYHNSQAGLKSCFTGSSVRMASYRVS